MQNDALATVSTLATPQSEPADARQKRNAAGGFAFQVSDEVRVNRFLTLGVDGGTYYATDHELALDNAQVIVRAAQDRPVWLVARIVEISSTGRAPRQNPAIFALAACSALADEKGRKAALNALPTVCRTGSHLFQFVGYAEQFRGWGRGLKRAVADWYLNKDLGQLAYQMVKYRQRQGWSHRDLLRLAHPVTDRQDYSALFEWVVRGYDNDRVPKLVSAFVQAQNTTDVDTWVTLIGAHPLSWEMLPDAALSQPKVWQALIEQGIPQTALMRQLPRLTRLGVLTGDTLRTVTEQLTDVGQLRRGRVHPVNVLVALRTYANGFSARGDTTWTPVAKVIDALDSAFYAAFGTVEPANKRTLVALDVSGSMGGPVSGLTLSCREASAALGMVTMATEPDATCVGFTSGTGGRWGHTAISQLPISPRQRLDDVVDKISGLSFGGTDCSLPMQWALTNSRSFDTFIVLTDNETWAGRMHPHQALAQYRRETGIPARLAVVGMTSTECSIADPTDPGMLDMAGFDAAVPNLISDFSRGMV